MFTGLVEMAGHVCSTRALASGVRLSIEHAYIAPQHRPLELGESISVSGVCLTVAELPVASSEATTPGQARFEVDVSVETLAKTTLGNWQVGTRVNLERALALGERLGGHLVTGHVDGIGEVLALTPEGDMTRIQLGVPVELARYVARKGSICLDGVSLTVNAVADGPSWTTVELSIIPHTRQVTTLGDWALGTRVNLEIDLIARYIERLLPGESLNLG